MTRLSWREHGWGWVLVALAGVGCLGTVVVFSPGYISSGDAMFQLAQALGRRHLNDWHPPIMSLLWRALIDLTGTPASMAVFQSLLLWASLLVIAWCVWDLTGRRGRSLAVLGLGLAPQVLTFVGVVWKDTQMAFAFLATTAVVFVAMRLQTTRPGLRSATRWGLFGLGLLFLVYAVLVRKNGIFAALPVFVMLVLAVWPKPGRRTWATAFAALVLGLVLPSLAISWIARPYHVSQVSQIMLDDVLNVPSVAELRSAHVPPDLRAHLLSARQKCHARGAISNAYWMCYGYGEHGRYSEIAHRDQVQSLWLHEIPRHIAGYVEYRLQLFSKLLFKTRYIYSGRVDKNNLGLHIAHPRLQDALRTYIKGFGRDLPIIFRGWFWLVVGLVLSFRPGRGLFSMPARALGLSTAMYILGYLPILPVWIYRYIYWPAVAGSLGLLLVWLGHVGRDREPTVTDAVPASVPVPVRD